VKRWLPVAVFLPASLLLMAGCPDQSTHTTIPNGITVITKNDVGTKTAPGGPSCRWWMTRGSRITDNGNTTGTLKRRVQQKGVAADQSQTVIIGTGNVGDTFHADNCGGFK
jgi:hypothetical protein